ncbi:uncharacterized protein LOC118741715 [Rhagoletis pomonella]|uniref:uncharacterized protein LOC118741715 n=1 Tax=Rhagoletis pomonella TaxID=28610 RepID=UPI001783579E|nr:uncharacterized protein LOC118741715 [Rhagoletis pomonella]
MIFPLMLFNSLDRKAYGNRIFDPVISELISLESNGITFQDRTIYFVLSVCVGDNKGINSMLGFTESFSSNYWCRFCTLKKDILQKSLTESPSYLRDKRNYEIHLKSKSSKETGIVSECNFNVLRDFHAVENYSVDVMHDIFEGILNLEISLIILSYIRTEKYFTIDDINNRINFFDYGHIHNLNRPPQLCLDNLKTLKIRYSASEMMVFSKYLGIIIGDWIPENDSKWELFKILMEIIKIILSDSISNSMISQLEILITEHHKMFVEIFQLPLRPKHHLMLHYPRVIRNIGPLTQVWSMRFESKHKVFKEIARSTKSRTNICLSILKRYTLKQKTDFETFNISQKIKSFGPKIQNYSQMFKKLLNEDKDVEFYKWISFCNVIIKANVVLEIGHNGEYTQYGLVEEIGFSKANSKVYVFLKKMNTLYYDCNRFCDIVELINEKQAIILTHGFIKTYNLIHFNSLNMVL